MFATDFIFDGQRASDYDLVICSFDGEYQTATGGEAEFEVVKPPDSDKYTFYGAQYNTPLEWIFSIMKNPCVHKNDSGTHIFSKEEERMICKWLEKRDGYHWFNFCQDENEDDVLYNVQIKATPHQINGKTVGFDLTVISNSAFGYTRIQKKKATINKEKPLILYIDNDTSDYILPEVKITGSGDFYISNDSDLSKNITLGKAPEFINVKNNVYMDSENGIMEGVNPNEFNWHFLRLVDGKNSISTNSITDLIIEILYREVRRVIS